MSAPPARKRSGLSLYADLLDPPAQAATNNGSGTTISSAPVRYDLQGAANELDRPVTQKKKDASLQFQPTRRPQAAPKKTATNRVSSASLAINKPPTGLAVAPTDTPAKSNASAPQLPPQFQKTNFLDWVGDEEEDDFGYQGRQRQQRKKKKKGKGETRVWDWNDIYDPSFPNKHADYKGSEEQAREVRDWKARLYHHQLKEARKNSRRAAASSDDDRSSAPVKQSFVPPTGLNFAPPKFDDAETPKTIEADDEYYPESIPAQSRDMSASPPASFALKREPSDASGADLYMTQQGESRRNSDTVFVHHTERLPPISALPSESPVPTQPTKPADPVNLSAAELDAKRADAQAKIAAFKAKLAKSASTAPVVSTPPPPPRHALQTPPVPTAVPEPPPPPPPPSEPPAPLGMISRAPVRYELPPPADPMTEDSVDAEQPQIEAKPTDTAENDRPRSNRPGQKGFAERLLMKYGWEKGQGLGAHGEGITTAIVAKADKRKKRSDAEGGGFSTPANMGTIVGGKRRKLAAGDATEKTNPESSADRFNDNTSEVIKLEGMLAGIDVSREIEDNNMMQRIGDEMGNKYGNVERLFIWRQHAGGNDEVFVKFTSALSALRAVNATDGMTFAGNHVRARFYDAEKFESGEYV